MPSTLIAFEVLEQPVTVLVNVKVALPGAIPSTNPELLILAMELSLLTQVPPVAGDNCVVWPLQTSKGETIIGKEFTVIVVDDAVLQPKPSV